ncbi:MAG: Asp23/Gls24 family envelope stress response protein [Thermicanus sp.]|nr:Asp23/Gls24 family envelope stress response protein [Thermicanus sp.]
MEEMIAKMETTSLGKIQIAPEVISVIAGLATSEVEGVHTLSGGLVGDLAERFGRKKNLAKGVEVEVGQKEVAVDISVTVEYGYSIPKIAAEIQDHVRTAIENMTGLHVVEVNVHVLDVRFHPISEVVVPEEKSQEINLRVR